MSGVQRGAGRLVLRAPEVERAAAGGGCALRFLCQGGEAVWQRKGTGTQRSAEGEAAGVRLHLLRGLPLEWGRQRARARAGSLSQGEGEAEGAALPLWGRAWG